MLQLLTEGLYYTRIFIHSRRYNYLSFRNDEKWADKILGMGGFWGHVPLPRDPVDMHMVLFQC